MNGAVERVEKGRTKESEGNGIVTPWVQITSNN